MGEESERKKTGIGEDGDGNRRRMGEDSEREKEDEEDGRGWERDSEEDRTGTLRREGKGLGERRNGLIEGRKRDFEEEKKGNRESYNSIAVFS